jgi:hypothetical protein
MPLRYKLRQCIDPVSDHTGAIALSSEDHGRVLSNAGAAGAITMTLPPAMEGLEFTFLVAATQQLRIDPNGTDTISQPSSGVPGSAGKYLWADAIGESIRVICRGTNWFAVGAHGTWTHEV